MLDHVSVVSFGGVVVWQKSYSPAVNRIPSSSPSHPVNAAIREALIEHNTLTAPKSTGKTSEIADGVVTDMFKVKWAIDREFKLIFLIAYQKVLMLGYIDELLSGFKSSFCDMYASELLADPLQDYSKFEDIFDSLLQTAEDKDAEEKKNRGPRSFQQSSKTPNATEAIKSTQPEEVRKSPRPFQKKEKDSKKSPAATSKRARKWNGNEDTAGLDYSDSTELPEPAVAGNSVAAVKDGIYDAPEMESKKQPPKSTGSTGLFSYLNTYISGKNLTEADLEPVITKLRDLLISKNVASDIAHHITSSVQTSLMGTKSTSYSLASTVKAELTTTLKKILTPSTSLDLLNAIKINQAQNKVYSIVFIGVNGVGKSTNLSKVAYLLLRNNLKVLIAACDTFRAGAVEQLRVHARNLGASVEGAKVELFEKGYGKDAAGIAKDALNYAEGKFDVVLIDTAGRMQDNEPLMRALAKLVSVNNPDKIIFVGEALVGNEAVDQLVKFNAALTDFSGVRDARKVDGIILTKFDTVDDKVGAALSMTYITKRPILFTGVGQTYEDLRRLNVTDIVEKLLD